MELCRCCDARWKAATLTESVQIKFNDDTFYSVGSSLVSGDTGELWKY